MAITINNEIEIKDERYYFTNLSPDRYRDINEEYVSNIIQDYSSHYNIKLVNTNNNVILYQEKFNFSEISILPGSKILGNNDDIFSYIEEEVKLEYIGNNEFKIDESQNIFKNLINSNKNNSEFINVIISDDRIVEVNEIEAKLSSLKELLASVNMEDSFKERKKEEIVKYLEENERTISKKFIRALQTEIDNNFNKYNITFTAILDNFIEILKFNDTFLLQNGKVEQFIKEWDYESNLNLANDYANEVVDEKINTLKRNILTIKNKIMTTGITDDNFTQNVKVVKNLKYDLDLLSSRKSILENEITIMLNDEIINIHSELSGNGEKIKDIEFKHIIHSYLVEEFKNSRYHNDLNTIEV